MRGRVLYLSPLPRKNSTWHETSSRLTLPLSNPLLKKALEAKLYEDTKDHIKLSALNVSGATVVQPDLQEKIDAIKTRLIKQYGYNEQSASDVLDYVGSIFARGDLAEKD